MHFSSSLLSSVILVLGYLTNAALCVPTSEPSKFAVLNNNQQPFQSTGNSTATAIPLINMLIPWMREGLDPKLNYRVVTDPACRGPPWVKDHFIELQWIRNYMLSFTGTLSIESFNTIVQYANSINNVFWINAELNNNKSKKPLAEYIGDTSIHKYLCSDFENDQTLVAQVVQAFLNNLINDADPSVSAIGTALNNDIALVNLQCP